MHSPSILNAIEDNYKNLSGSFPLVQDKLIGYKKYFVICGKDLKDIRPDINKE